jgi:hypothetical protein
MPNEHLVTARRAARYGPWCADHRDWMMREGTTCSHTRAEWEAGAAAQAEAVEALPDVEALYRR